MSERRRSLVRRGRVAVIGTLIILLGFVLMPLPGPGTLIVMAGLAYLQREFAWAGRLLGRIRDRAGFLGRWIKN